MSEPVEDDDWGDEATVAAVVPKAAGDLSLRIAPNMDVCDEGGSCSVMVGIQFNEADAGAAPGLQRTQSGHAARVPVDICCVVDISGSMGTDATLEAEGAVRSNGLSVLDIVKHAVRSVMHILKDQDRLGLVVFDDKAEIVFNLTAMTAEGRSLCIEALDGLRPRGQTNLWEGIRVGMEALRDPAGTVGGSHKTLLVLTDGQPNISPPDGHLPELRKYKDSYPDFHFRLNTFGFGYDLDSELLSDLAAEGHGTYAFIPDAVILGTVFVNSVATVLSTRLQNATLHLMARGGAEFTGPVLGGHLVTEASWGRVVSVGPLQFGQSREVVVPMRIPGANLEGLADAGVYLEAVLMYPTLDGREATASAMGSERKASDDAVVATLRSETVDVGCEAVKQADAGNCEVALENVKALASRIDAVGTGIQGNERLLALKADVDGRMSKAVTGSDRFNRWGKHYLRALTRAHQLQTCTNFMDPGVQVYGGNLFRAVREEGDSIFVTIPAPRPAKDETGIPCERCHREIAFADYAEHVDTCGTTAGHRPAATAPARQRTPSPDMNDYYAGSGGG